MNSEQWDYKLAELSINQYLFNHFHPHRISTKYPNYQFPSLMSIPWP